MIAVVKLVAISITVLSGFRGGFIFPLFLVGTSLGQVVTGLHIPFVSGLPPVLLSMCFAAGEFIAVIHSHHEDMAEICVLPNYMQPVYLTSLLVNDTGNSCCSLLFLLFTCSTMRFLIQRHRRWSLVLNLTHDQQQLVLLHC